MSAEPIIRFDGVSKAYGSSAVLNGIDLEIQRGEKVALMGFSGCGKTTLLRCINGLEPFDEGKLLVNGYDLGNPQLDWSRFRAKVVFVFQQFNLFPHLTVLENIILGPIKINRTPKAEAVERAHQLLAQVGIGDKANPCKSLKTPSPAMI